MRIAVFSDDGIRVATHGGRSRGCLVYDIEAGVPQEREFRPLPHADEPHQHVHGGHHAHGKGHNHDDILSLVADCETAIGGGMGRRLRDDLAQRGIDVVLTDEPDAAEAARKFAAGDLVAVERGGCGH